jgi:hypothetical protein
MLIRNYQIHNVLNVYRRQLAQESNAGNSKNIRQHSSLGHSALASAGKRKSIIDKVTTNIVDKISMLSESTKIAAQFQDVLEKEANRASELDDKSFKEFIFNIIDHQNRKMTRSISVENSKEWISRLEAHARQVALNSGHNPKFNRQGLSTKQFEKAESTPIGAENQAAFAQTSGKGDKNA